MLPCMCLSRFCRLRTSVMAERASHEVLHESPSSGKASSPSSSLSFPPPKHGISSPPPQRRSHASSGGSLFHPHMCACMTWALPIRSALFMCGGKNNEYIMMKVVAGDHWRNWEACHRVVLMAIWGPPFWGDDALHKCKALGWPCTCVMMHVVSTPCTWHGGLVNIIGWGMSPRMRTC